MIHYKGKTFCNFGLICKASRDCDRAITKQILEDARLWWGGDDPPISVYADFPDCFVRWSDEEV